MEPCTLRVDVLVVGGGPAGCATALGLARSGVAVALLERSDYAGPRIGEHLVPGARPLLERLGAWERTARGGHVECPGTRAAWGGPDPYDREYLWSPYGSAWGLDRARFDAALAETVREAGVPVLLGSPRRPRREPAGWRVRVEPGGREARARWLVDATGRSAAVARRLGGRREACDRLVALAAWLPTEDRDARLLLEACEGGWWYTAPVPEGRMVAAFLTDADLAARPYRSAWCRALLQAPLTAARLGGARPERVRALDASTARTLPCAGDGWLAVGDAASAFDCLSSQGIPKALAGGLWAARALRDGSPAALEGYRGQVEDEFQRYQEARAHYYSLEDRWPDSPFWARRQAAPAGRTPR